MFCKNCGQQVPDTAQFCPNCGTKIEPVIYADESTNQTTQEAYEQTASASQEKQAKKAFGKIKSVLSSLVTIALIIAAISGFSKHPVTNMKEVVFDDFGAETIGEAVERSITHPEWSADKIDKNHYRVTVKGFMKDIGGNFSMTFDMNYLDDEVYAKPILAAYDGEAFDDWFSIAIAMGLLYG